MAEAVAVDMEVLLPIKEEETTGARERLVTAKALPAEKQAMGGTHGEEEDDSL